MRGKYVVIAILLVYIVALGTPVGAQDFKINSPLGSDIDNIGDVINFIARNLLGIAIPVATIMYIWAGILFIISQGNPGDTQKAKNILLYTSIGLAIILIGGGFVDLIQSFLEAA